MIRIPREAVKRVSFKYREHIVHMSSLQAPTSLLLSFNRVSGRVSQICSLNPCIRITLLKCRCLERSPGILILMASMWFLYMEKNQWYRISTYLIIYLHAIKYNGTQTEDFKKSVNAYFLLISTIKVKFLYYLQPSLDSLGGKWINR